MIKNNTNYNIILLSQTKKSNTLNNVLTFEWYVNNSTDQGFEKLILSIGNNESTDNGSLSASLQCSRLMEQSFNSQSAFLAPLSTVTVAV